jgi:hypothetical protein
MRIMVLVNKRTFKKLFITLFVFVLFLQPLTVFAEYAPILDKEEMEEGNKPGIIEKNLSKLILNAGNWILDLSNAQDVSVLVFQRAEVADGDNDQLTNKSSADRANMYFGIFPAGLFDAISAFNTFFTSLLPIPMVLILSFGGLFLLLDVVKSNESRSRAKEMLLGTVAAVMFIRFGHILWGVIVDINYVITDGIYTVLKSNGIEVVRFTDTIWNSSQYSDLSASQSIGVALMLILAIGMTFVLNYQYMMRLLQLSVLLVLFPFVVLSAMIPSKSSALNTWFTAFVSNVFMQAGHAVALGLFFYSLTKASGMSFWLVMAMMFGLPAMADVVNRITGAFTGEGGGGGMKSSASNMSGMAGMMAISKIGKTVAGGKDKKADAQGQGSDSGRSNESTVGGGVESNSSNAPITSSGSMSQGNGSAPIGGGSSITKGSVGGGGALSRVASAGSSLAKAAGRGGKALATSSVGGAMIRGAAVATTAGVGSVVGTMTTGNGNTGAYMGAQLGRPIASAGNFVREKVGKGIQQASEYTSGALDAKQGIVDSPHAYTNERLGFNEQAQLYDKQEMGRMGQELIGGKTGKAIGSAVGAVSNFVGSKVGSPEQKEAIARVGERQGLVPQIEQSRFNQGHAKQELQEAKLEHNHMTSQYGPKSEAGIAYAQQNGQNALHPEYQKSQQKYNQKEANFNQHAYQTDQLEQKHSNMYRINQKAQSMTQQANDMKPLQSQLKNSGTL